MKNKFLKGIVASFALAVSGIANAGLIEYELLSISDRQSSTTNTYSGDGYISAYSSYYGGIFCIERVSCKTTVQTNIDDLLNLGDITINSVFLSFDLKRGSTNTQNVTASAFDSNGVLAHYFSAPTSYAQSIFSVTGLSSNSLDITDIFEQGYNLGNDWFALHLNASTENMWTWTFALSDLDDANVRIAVDYTVSSVPEPSTLAIFALGMIGLASRRFKKQS
jgi:hypothetical protein